MKSLALKSVFIYNFVVTLTCAMRCSDLKYCGECTRRLSWKKNSNCRWCPPTKSCHTYGAFLTNPCGQQQIEQAKDCPDPFENHHAFNELTSIRLLKHSATAYHHQAGECFQNVTAVQLYSTVSAACDVVGHECRAFTLIDDEIDSIVVVFRGTNGYRQLVTELFSGATMPWVSNTIGGKPGISTSVAELLRAKPNYRVTVTGHSLGGALAALCAVQISATAMVNPDRMHVYTFGEPRVGNYLFARAYSRHVPHSWRVVHARDIVAHIPSCNRLPSLAPCVGWFGGPYHHAWEIFYPSSMRSEGNSSFKMCNGIPFQEDKLCSNRFAPTFNIDDHRWHYGYDVKAICWSDIPDKHVEPTTNAVLAKGMQQTTALAVQLTSAAVVTSASPDALSTCRFDIILQTALCHNCNFTGRIQFQVKLMVEGLDGLQREYTVDGAAIMTDSNALEGFVMSCVKDVQKARFLNSESFGSAWMLGCLTVDMFLTDDRHPILRNSFTASEWISGIDSQFANMDTGYLVKDTAVKKAAYILTIQTKRHYSVTWETQNFDTVYVGFRGSLGRTRVTPITEKFRQIVKKPNNNFEPFSSITFTIARLPHIGEVTGVLVSLDIENDWEVDLNVFDRNQPKADIYTHDWYEFDERVMFTTGKTWHLFTPTKNHTIRDEIGPQEEFDYTNSGDYE